MATPIEMVYKYQAGNKIIEGYFPVYNSTESFDCATTVKLQPPSLYKELLNEADPLPVLAPTSTEYDPVEFILKKGGIDYNLFQK
jgi:hypothetical protein